MSRILIASITELCGPDHHGDAAVIAGWTRNKTPAELRKILANPDVAVYVAERGGVPLAVGCIGLDGWIRLNYVAPEFRFHGASKALLAAMEAALRAGGVALARLESTATAHRFYLSAGWTDIGAPGGSHAVEAFPMEKRL